MNLPTQPHDGRIRAWTDGCLGGAGIVLVYNDDLLLVSTTLDLSSSTQYAELVAINEVFLRINSPRSLTVTSDSEYAIGCMVQDWTFKKNVPLILAMRRLLDVYRRTAPVEFRHVKGHSGDEFNALADYLAGLAKQGRETTVERHKLSRYALPPEVVHEIEKDRRRLAKKRAA